MKLEFGNPLHIRMANAKRKHNQPWSQVYGSYQGPETCRTCEFRVGNFKANTYYKCSNPNVPRPTNGPGTDIRLRDQACVFFKEAVKK